MHFPALNALQIKIMFIPKAGRTQANPEKNADSLNPCLMSIPPIVWVYPTHCYCILTAAAIKTPHSAD